MSPGPVTKRMVLGQVIVCAGCCCGDVSRGRPAVPVDWLKEEWRRRGLLKKVQLTISGCAGPCDVPNVIVVVGSRRTEWLGNITEFAQYQAIVDWATRSRESGGLLALPTAFEGHKFDPFLQTD